MVQMRAARASTRAERGSKSAGRLRPSWTILRAGLEGLGAGWKDPYGLRQLGGSQSQLEGPGPGQKTENEER